MYFMGLNNKLSKITKVSPMDNFNMDNIISKNHLISKGFFILYVTYTTG